MAQTVDEMITDILVREGGFVDHPADRGGPTKFGVTQKTLSAWLGRPATIEDVRDLEEGTARRIYEKNYFLAAGLDQLPPALQAQAFDIAINSGPRRAIKLVQAVINQTGFGPVQRDGIMGPKTAEAAAKAAEHLGQALGNALADERAKFYQRIVAADPSQAAFLKGWLRRADEFRSEIV